ncbi:phage tail protein [Vibrio parahaemolyticus]|uniref:phage tail protein n=2 Tax=Vibrio harveyi group TaxID=717610 RepID=UPI001F1671CB|nr:phage tail protein [Vibrio parahaemolyticus]UJX32989.1 phage tail protein [Vibrio parahaemolyticus]
MHLSLNDHVMSLINGNPLEEHTYETIAGWSDFDAIESPRQDPTSNPLDNWTQSFVAFKGDGEAEAEALRTMAKAHEIVMVTDGKGRSWGRFTIRNVKTSYTKIIEKGQAQVVKITLTLKEYRQKDENPSQAQRNG